MEKNKMNKTVKFFSLSLSLSFLSACGVSPVLPPDLNYNSSALTVPAAKNCACKNKNGNGEGIIPDSPDVSNAVQNPESNSGNTQTPVNSDDKTDSDDELELDDDLPEIDTEMPESDVDKTPVKEKTKAGKVIDSVKNFFKGIFKKKDS